MKHAFQAIAMSTMFAFPAFAADENSATALTCADFMAMDPAGRMKAVEKMPRAEPHRPSNTVTPAERAPRVEDRVDPTGDTMAEERVTSVREACERYPQHTARDAVREYAGY